MSKWYEIQAKADESADILIYEQIGQNFWGEGIGAKQFVDDLKALGEVKTLNVRINSPGGNVFDGNAIYNALKAHKATVNVFVDGVAASIASIIAMAGDTITMPENAMMMIHDPSTMAWGSAADMRKTADLLDKIKDGLIGTYHAKSGMEKELIADAMADETWLTAKEAKDWGFADVVTDAVQIAAHFDLLSKYKKTPEFLTATAQAAAIPAGNTSVTTKGVATMSDKDKRAPEITAEIVAAEYSAIADHFRNQGAEAERNRIKSVEENSMPGHEKLVAELKFDGKTTGPEAAVKILNAERTKRAERLTQIKDDAPAAVVAMISDDSSDNLPIEDRAQKAWDSKPDIRAEFSSVKSYLAFLKAEESGKARILKK